MLDILYQTELNVVSLFDNSDKHSMFIDYHDPFVQRIWIQMDKYRVNLHKSYPSKSSAHSLFHPHPWESAIRILKGTYEMGIGHSTTNDTPLIDCKLILGPGSCYEMTEPDGWHYINPINGPVYSLMVTGDKFERQMPVEPNKKFRELTEDEMNDMLNVLKKYYHGK